MIDYPNTLADRANYLIAHKGDMSIELWNDRAQCVLAPLLQELAAARLVVEAVKKEEAALASDDPALYHQHSNFYADVRAALEAYDKARGKGPTNGT